MESGKPRSSMRKIYCKDEDSTDVRINRRISFNEKKFVRVFSEKEGLEHWDNTYVVSDHTNEEGTSIAIDKSKALLTKSAKSEIISNEAKDSESQNEQKDSLNRTQENSSLHIENSVNVTLLPQEIQKQLLKKESLKSELSFNKKKLGESCSFFMDTEKIESHKSSLEKIDNTTDFIKDLYTPERAGNFSRMAIEPLEDITKSSRNKILDALINGNKSLIKQKKKSDIENTAQNVSLNVLNDHDGLMDISAFDHIENSNRVKFLGTPVNKTLLNHMAQGFSKLKDNGLMNLNLKPLKKNSDFDSYTSDLDSSLYYDNSLIDDKYKKLNFLELNDAIEQGKIKIFPDEYDTFERDGKMSATKSGPDDNGNKISRKNLQLRGTLNFNEDMEIDSQSSPKSQTKIVSSESSDLEQSPKIKDYELNNYNIKSRKTLHFDNKGIKSTTPENNSNENILPELHTPNKSGSNSRFEDNNVMTANENLKELTTPSRTISSTQKKMLQFTPGNSILEFENLEKECLMTPHEIKKQNVLFQFNNQKRYTNYILVDMTQVPQNINESHSPLVNINKTTHRLTTCNAVDIELENQDLKPQISILSDDSALSQINSCQTLYNAMDFIPKVSSCEFRNTSKENITYNSDLQDSNNKNEEYNKDNVIFPKNYENLKINSLEVNYQKSGKTKTEYKSVSSNLDLKSKKIQRESVEISTIEPVTNCLLPVETNCKSEQTQFTRSNQNLLISNERVSLMFECGSNPQNSLDIANPIEKSKIFENSDLTSERTVSEYASLNKNNMPEYKQIDSSVSYLELETMQHHNFDNSYSIQLPRKYSARSSFNIKDDIKFIAENNLEKLFNLDISSSAPHSDENIVSESEIRLIHNESSKSKLISNLNKNDSLTKNIVFFADDRLATSFLENTSISLVKEPLLNDYQDIDFVKVDDVASDSQTRKYDEQPFENASLNNVKCKRCSQFLNRESIEKNKSNLFKKLPLDMKRRITRLSELQNNININKQVLQQRKSLSQRSKNVAYLIQAEEVVNHKLKAKEVIGDFYKSLQRFKAGNKEFLPKKKPICFRTNNVKKFIETYELHWTFDSEMKSESQYIFSHRNVLTHQLIIDFKNLEEENSIHISSINVESCRIPKKNWSAFDFMLESQLRIPIDLNVNAFFSGNADKIIYKTLIKVDKIFTEAAISANQLWKVICEKQAQLLRSGDRTIVRKIVHTGAIISNDKLQMSEKEFKIEIGYHRAISFKNILKPKIHFFCEEIQYLQGIDFIEKLLNDPCKYLQI